MLGRICKIKDIPRLLPDLKGGILENELMINYHGGLSMKSMKEALRSQLPKEAIGELMLAKEVLEEKNRIIEEKDTIIVELTVHMRAQKTELQKLKAEHADSKLREEKALKTGAEQLIRDLLSILSVYDEPSPYKMQHESLLVKRTMKLLKEKYGLEIIEKIPDTVDPEVHRVIEVVNGHDSEDSIECLSKGYRVGGKLLKPAWLKVVKGGGDVKNDARIPFSQKPEIIQCGSSTPTDPQGAA